MRACGSAKPSIIKPSIIHPGQPNLEQTMPVKHLSDGNPDGTVLGQSASDLISFYNAAPVAQRCGAAQAAVGTTAPVSGGFGYTEAQAQAIITLLNEIRATLVATGLMKGQ
jgi:hypothetical protein